MSAQRGAFALPEHSRSGDFADKAGFHVGLEVQAGVSALTVAEQQQVAEFEHRRRAGFGGLCKDCHRPIPPARLAAVPYALRCVPCQSVFEVSRRRR